MAEFAPVLPHGAIVEVFPDIFQVQGTFRMGPGLTITRNMTILRYGTELALVNSVRLDAAGLAALDKLGTVKHLFKVGAFHGADDAFYVDRYHPTFWAPPRAKYAEGLQHDRDLLEGESPLPDLTVFNFAHAKLPEVTLILARHGGLLLPCDSYQNWTTFAGCSLIGKVVARLMGFGPTLIGGPWTKAMGPDVRQDFDRLLQLTFDGLLPAHGTVLKTGAKSGLRVAVQKRFG